MRLLSCTGCECRPDVRPLRPRRRCHESDNSQAYHQCDDRYNGQCYDYLGPGNRGLARGSLRLPVNQEAEYAIVVFVRHHPNGQQHRLAGQALHADVYLHIAAASGNITFAGFPLQVLQSLSCQRTSVLPLNAELFHDHILGAHLLGHLGLGQFERTDVRRLAGCENPAGTDQHPRVAAVMVAGHGIPVAASTRRRAVAVRGPIRERAGLEHPIRHVNRGNFCEHCRAGQVARPPETSAQPLAHDRAGPFAVDLERHNAVRGQHLGVLLFGQGVRSAKRATQRLGRRIVAH